MKRAQPVSPMEDLRCGMCWVEEIEVCGFDDEEESEIHGGEAERFVAEDASERINDQNDDRPKNAHPERGG